MALHFAELWREHGNVLSRRDAYHEAAPQLVLMGFLHRIVNGGGYVAREYGIGRGRIDLHVRWPYTDAAGKRAWQQEALEISSGSTAARSCSSTVAATPGTSRSAPASSRS